MSDDDIEHSNSLINKVALYYDLIGGLIFCVLAMIFMKYTYVGLLLSAVAIALFSISIMQIAEIVSKRLKDPYSSMFLTFSAVVVEVILLFNIMLSSGGSQVAMEAVKSGIIATVIVDMNILLGLAFFVGGIKFKMQKHNEDTSNSYTTILYVASIALFVPSILDYAGDSMNIIKIASWIISGVLFLFYVSILIFQTKTHIDFFESKTRSKIFRYKKQAQVESTHSNHKLIYNKISNTANFFVIFAIISVIAILAENFAHNGLKIADSLNIPPSIFGLVVAIVSVTPEIFTAIKAAKGDQIQRVINIGMGASTVSILLTVPALSMLGLFIGVNLILDFNIFLIGGLLFTILLAWKTTYEGETDYLKGVAHITLFICYAIMSGFYV